MFADELDAYDTANALDSAVRRVRNAPLLSLPRGSAKSQTLPPSHRWQRKGTVAGDKRNSWDDRVPDLSRPK